jgi:hypothetical protein
MPYKRLTLTVLMFVTCKILFVWCKNCCVCRYVFLIELFQLKLYKHCVIEQQRIAGNWYKLNDNRPSETATKRHGASGRTRVANTWMWRVCDGFMTDGRKVESASFMYRTGLYILMWGESSLMFPLHYISTVKLLQSKANAIPLLAWAGPKGSRRLRLPDFKTIGTWRWQGCHPYAPAAFTPAGNIPGSHFCWGTR